jgi:hypothetical protein
MTRLRANAASDVAPTPRQCPVGTSASTLGGGGTGKALERSTSTPNLLKAERGEEYGEINKAISVQIQGIIRPPEQFIICR